MKPEKDHFPKSDIEGFSRLCMKDKYSYISSDIIVHKLTKQLLCEVVGVPEAYYLNSLSIVSKKEFSYKELFNIK